MRTKLFSDAIDEWLKHLDARGMAKGSIKTHQIQLRRALTLWGNIYVSNINSGHMDKLFATYPWAPKTRNLYLGNYKMFFGYCRRHNWIPKDQDPTETWRPVKVPKKPMPRINFEDFARVLDAATDPRDRAVVALGLFTMCRASEIQTLRIGNLDFDSGDVYIYRHKTKEADVLPMAKELRMEMMRWLNTYRDLTGGELKQDWYLVPAKMPLPMAWDHRLNRLAPTGAPAPLKPDTPMSHPYRASQRALYAFGLTGKGIGGHVLRRSGARVLFDRLRHEGYDGALMRVQAILGHTSGTITENYLGVDVEKIQRNELFRDKEMFPGMYDSATVTDLKAV
jgi:integrase